MPAAQLNGAVFLLPDSATPCGVEMFARRLSQETFQAGADVQVVHARHGLRALPHAWAVARGSSRLVVNFPIVAWKRTILLPLIYMIAAGLCGRQVIVIQHEWADLDWRRRMLVSVYLLFARTVLLSSPMIARQFADSAIARCRRFTTGLIPIPANIDRPDVVTLTPLARHLAALKQDGRLIIGHFGSIYPKKRAGHVLAFAADLKMRGLRPFVVYIGDFVRGSDRVRADFAEKCQELELRDDVTISGFVAEAADLYGVMAQLDVFAYSFEEGLSSRRGSVLACLQSGRPVVVNAPAQAGEFDHHRMYQKALGEGRLTLVASQAQPRDYADAMLRVAGQETQADVRDATSWPDAARALAMTALDQRTRLDGPGLPDTQEIRRLTSR